MRMMKVLLGVLALSGAGQALAHDPAHGHDHEGCCCRHDEHAGHHASHHGSKAAEKTTKEKAAPQPEQQAPTAPAEKLAPTTPK